MKDLRSYNISYKMTFWQTVFSFYYFEVSLLSTFLYLLTLLGLTAGVSLVMKIIHTISNKLNLPQIKERTFRVIPYHYARRY